jgi:hypothetical protein
MLVSIGSIATSIKSIYVLKYIAYDLIIHDLLTNDKSFADNKKGFLFLHVKVKETGTLSAAINEHLSYSLEFSELV